jgi:leader peptidase (prepilin peptidase)/N-methyltransferase
LQVLGPSASDDDLRPSWTFVLAGALAVAAMSAASLPWPLALTSTALGALMLAGADVDARAYLLPDTITFSTLGCGLLAALALDPSSPWDAVSGALARAALTAGALAALRIGYLRLRGKEGIGLGDVKLAGGVGAWLPLGDIAVCFALAAGAALLYVFVRHRLGDPLRKTSRIPFGAFLCPSLWLVYYAGVALGA